MEEPHTETQEDCLDPPAITALINAAHLLHRSAEALAADMNRNAAASDGTDRRTDKHPNVK